MTDYAYSSPQAALDALLERIRPVGAESIALADATGRVLAAPVVADRDSPPCDVSAMDGFAVRSVDCSSNAIAIAGAIRIGTAPPSLVPNTALRIVTGAAIPFGADAIVKHEDVEIVGDAVRPRVAVRSGDHIRKRGENLSHNFEVVPAGTCLTAPVIAALATFGVARPIVHHRVRVAIVTSGDELVPVDASPDEWHIRDSNGAALAAMLGANSTVVLCRQRHAVDEEPQLREQIALAMSESDAVIITGGVSMGERDFVPKILRRLSVRVAFHRLPQRPGKPLLAGVGWMDGPVLALPGNPLSVLVTARRFAVAAVRRRAGLVAPEPIASVLLDDPDSATIPLWWHRLVRITSPGRAQLVMGRGSGDVPSAARSDGFVELPPGAGGPGPWPFLPWS